MAVPANRRDFCRRAAALAGAGLLPAGVASLARAQAAPHVAPITMVINQSPWFDGFRQLVEQYQKESGNRIELDVNPYAGALDKIRNSLRAGSGSYDLLAIDNNWMVEMFDGGFLTPLTDLDPAFKLDAQVSSYGGTVFWNDKLHTFDPNGGKLMGVPINGNVEVFFYRRDLYEQKGLKVPETWDQALENATKLNDGSKVYGFVHRDDRDSALADFSNYLFSFGGDIFANASAGDFSIVLNSPAARRALEFYLRLGKAGGYPSPGSVSQGQMIQLMATGKAAQTVGIVGAWSQLEDPNKSAVVGRIEAALIPRGEGGAHASRAGHWIGAIARNVPRDKQAAALQFLRWFQTLDHQLAYTRYGAVPVRVDLGSSDLARDPRFRFLKAQAENSRVARMYAVVPEAAQMSSILSLRLNECIIGKASVVDTLNRAAAEMQDLMARSGRKTGRLPDLK
ncbi:MAG TPA: extracellular solute-binding protein [Casimicrobiaceae bacterium]|nr:extracellular solute-binding protein [Casimicrobiaceae bacterium]